jgi:hypothetical protein
MYQQITLGWVDTHLCHQHMHAIDEPLGGLMRSTMRFFNELIARMNGKHWHQEYHSHPHSDESLDIVGYKIKVQLSSVNI